MRKFAYLFVLCTVCTAVFVVIAAPLAPITYVDKVATNVLMPAKAYTDSHAPKVDLSSYVTTSNMNLRVDSATNVVWKCVWSNGVEYIYAYSNNTNILKNAEKRSEEK